MSFRLAALPVALSVLLLAFYAATGRLPLTGDEPHYLVMADGLVHDRTFDLRAAYTREGNSHRIYRSPLPAPHVVIVNHRWGPYHEPGLPMILALPYAVGGEFAARLTLCLLAGLLPLTLFRFLRQRLATEPAAWLAAGVSIGVPTVFGASQIYPDLLAGIVAAALLVWIADAAAAEPTLGGWARFWLIAGLLPWLNAKFLAATTALGLGAMLLLAARRYRRHLPPALTTCGLALIGPMTLAAFHVWAFQTPFGPRGLSELTDSVGRAAMMFLGLHYDQAQGMFWQQPLLLFGVAALVPFVRAQPRLALAWAALYAALIVPNAMEVARYGGGAPAGRFAWSAAWLWMIPAGVALQDRLRPWVRFVKPAVIAGLAYQALLAIRWVPDPAVLFPRLEENLAARNSLFPESLRAFLPSFYFWDFSSYWTYPPNVAVYAATALLLAAGVRQDRKKKTEDGTA